MVWIYGIQACLSENLMGLTLVRKIYIKGTIFIDNASISNAYKSIEPKIFWKIYQLLNKNINLDKMCMIIKLHHACM